MVVLIICKNEEDPIKSIKVRVLTTFYIDFSDAQWQLTLQSEVGFSPISNHPYSNDCSNYLQE